MGLVSYAIEPHDHASNLKGGILSLDAAHPVPDTIEIVKGSADGTKRLRFEVDGLTTATTRVITMADLDINLTPGTGSYAAALSGLTDDRVIRADGATGLQQSAVTIDDSGNISGIGNITLTGTVDGRDIATDGAALDTVVGVVAAHLVDYGNPHQVDADDVLHDSAIWNADRLQGYSIYDQAPSNDGVLWWDTSNNRYYATDIDTPLFKAGGRSGVKGELLAGSVSPGKYGYVAPGTDGYVLTADSTQTYGIKWAASPSGGYTDEQAQDAVGGILSDTTTIDFTYDDGTPSITADVKDNSLVAGKLTATATDKLFGRATAGAGAGEEIACTGAGRALLDDADAAAQRTTLGLGTAATHADTEYLLVAGTRALAGNWDAGSFKITAETFESDVSTGTSPLTIASTTKCTNLNADLLDGYHVGTSGATIPLNNAFNVWSAEQTYSLGGVWIYDNQTLHFGDAYDVKFLYYVSGARDYLYLGLHVGSAEQSGYFIIGEYADYDDWVPAAFTANPTLRIVSADSASANDYIDIFHNQTDGCIRCGTGTINFDDENLTTSGQIQSGNLRVDGDVYDDAGTAMLRNEQIGVDEKTWHIPNPTDGDAYVIMLTDDIISLLKVSAETDVASSTVNFNIEKRAYGSGFSTGADLMASDMVATDSGATPVTSFTGTVDGTSTQQWIAIAVTSTSGSPTGLLVNMKFKRYG